MHTPLRTPAAFLALTLLLAGWLHAWTLPTQSMWWTRGNTRPQWLELRQFRPLFWVATTLTGTTGRGHPFDGLIGCGPYTGPVVIKTEAGIRVVRAEALSVILGSENILAAAYERRTVHIDEFGLLAVSAVRQHIVPVAMPIEGLNSLDLEAVQTALYPEMAPGAGLAPRTRWNYAVRPIVHDTLSLLSLVVWIYSATGIPRWSLWKRAPKAPSA